NIDGTTATIEANEDVDLDEVFSYVKIDTSKNYDEAEVNMNDADEGVEFEGIEDFDWFAEYEKGSKNEVYPTGGFPNVGISNSKSLKFSLSKTFKDESENKSVDVRGSLLLSEKVDFSVYVYSGNVQVDFSLESQAKASIDITGKIETKKIKLADINIPTGVGDLTVGVEANFLISVDGKLSFNATLTSTTGFSIDTKSKSPKNTSKPMYVDTDIQVSSSVFIGIQAEPNIKAFGQILQLSVPIKVGSKISGETRNRTDTDSQKHLCESCIKGTVGGVLELSFKLKIDFKLVDFSTELKVMGVETKLFNFYVSSELGFGVGQCPNNSYLITINVVDIDSKPVSDADVSGNTTDSNGSVKLYYKAGSQTVTVSKSGYTTKSQSFDVTGPDTITIILYKPNENQNNNGSSNLGDISSKVNYLTKRIYLTDNTHEFIQWGSFSIRYTSDMNTWNVSGMTRGGTNRYSQYVYYYDLPNNTTHVQFIDPSSSYNKTGVVTLSSAFSNSYDNAYYFSSQDAVSLWPEKDFPQMPGIDNYYRDVYIRAGSSKDITPSNYDAGAGLEYSQVSDTSVAKRDVTGNRCVIQGLKAGTATITITPKGTTSSLDIGNSITVTIHVYGNIGAVMFGKSKISVGADPEEDLDNSSDVTEIEYYTVSKSELVPDAEYSLLILKGSVDNYQLNTDSLLYIDQSKADSEGNVSFAYYGDFSTEDYVVLIFGECNHELSDWIVVKEATTEEEGYRIKTCVKCNEVIVSEIIDKISPVEDTTTTVEKPTGDEEPTTTTTSVLPTETTSTAPIESGLLGDANGDEVIDVRDATTIQKYLARIKIDIILDNSDVNKDGGVDISDATLIQKYLSHVVDKL
ncbi:MAG: dockerin type I repeat-containing protein, partial [Ruminococcus sp.]